jgi:hypothetical protein
MKTAIEVNAEGIKTKVSNKEFESTKIQTAELIASEVKKVSDDNEAAYTQIKQRADAIELSVTTLGSGVEEFKEATNTSITGLGNTISEKATEILNSVGENYETKENAQSQYNALDGQFASYTKSELLPGVIQDTVSASYITGITDGRYADTESVQSQITTNLSGVTSKVSNLEGTVDTLTKEVSGVKGSVTEVKQTADGITSSVSAIENGKFKGKTLFTQNSDKFVFDGNVEIKNGILDSPEITGEEISLSTQNKKKDTFNNMYLTSNAMTMSYGYYNSEYEYVDSEKFCVYLGKNGDDASYVSLRLGEGNNSTTHTQSLILEKEKDLIRIGTYVSADHFVGIEIEPSSGKFSIPGATAPAVFG